MKKLVFVLSGGVLLGAAALCAAQETPPTPPGAYAAEMSLPSASAGMMEKAIKIAPRIHVFQAPMTVAPVPLANEMLIEQADGLVLVDSGKTRGAGLRLVALIRSISSKPVKAVIITHWHQDHVLGLGPILEAWPNAAIITHEATKERVLNDPSFEGMPRSRNDTAAHDASRAAALRGYADALGPNIHDPKLTEQERRGWADAVGMLGQRIIDEKGTYLVAPTITFTDRYTIADPVSPVEARFIGSAHTAGDIIVWTPKQRVAAVGDMVVAPIPYSGSNVLDWADTLRNLKALHPRVIVPGHGPVQNDEAFVDRMIAALVEFRAKAEGLLAGPPLTDEEVMAKVDVSDQKKIFAGDDPWRGYWFEQYFAQDVAKAYQLLRAAQAKP